MIFLRSASDTRCVRGRGLRGLVTSEQGLNVRPRRHSFIAWVNTVEIRQSSRFTVEGDTDTSLAYVDKNNVATYLGARHTGERFVDTYRRIGAEPFKESVYGTAR